VELTLDLPDGARLRRLTTTDLSPIEIAAIRDLLVAAFGDDEDERFTDDDWEHAVGGVHFVLDVAGVIVSHASVVARDLHVGHVPLRTGYVEAVATAPGWQGRGHGTAVIRDASRYVADRFELGALGTGVHRFYERLGWRRWIGPSSVRLPDGEGGERATPDDDGYLMVLATPTTPPIAWDAPISCEWRIGDVW
jgi:aminoglycoside 2'-N-acetyltransferase I